MVVRALHSLPSMVGRQKSYDATTRRANVVKHIERELGEAMFGGVVGAVTGAIAGPPGMITGGVIGFLVGLLAGMVAEQEDARAAIRERKLDLEIGIIRRSLGAKTVRHVPPRIGAYSFPSVAGRSSVHDTIPCEGPIPEDGG